MALTVMDKETARVRTTKLNADALKSLNAKTSEMLHNTLVSGLSVHFIANGRVVEKRPDGSLAEIKGPMKLNCKYDTPVGKDQGESR